MNASSSSLEQIFSLPSTYFFGLHPSRGGTTKEHKNNLDPSLFLCLTDRHPNVGIGAFTYSSINEVRPLTSQWLGVLLEVRGNGTRLAL